MPLPRALASPLALAFGGLLLTAGSGCQKRLMVSVDRLQDVTCGDLAVGVGRTVAKAGSVGCRAEVEFLLAPAGRIPVSINTKVDASGEIRVKAPPDKEFVTSRKTTLYDPTGTDPWAVVVENTAPRTSGTMDDAINHFSFEDQWWLIFELFFYEGGNVVPYGVTGSHPPSYADTDPDYCKDNIGISIYPASDTPPTREWTWHESEQIGEVWYRCSNTAGNVIAAGLPGSARRPLDVEIRTNQATTQFRVIPGPYDNYTVTRVSIRFAQLQADQ